jgi:Flp pilus assembly protein TadD
MAELETDAGNKAAAIQSFRKALELSPDSVMLMNNLAYLVGDSGGNLDEALTLVQKALQKAPGQANLIDTLGWIYLKKSWDDSALQIFRDLTEKYPSNPTFRYHFGMALLVKGDKATAKAEFRSGLARKPSGEVRQNIETALAKVQ